MSQGDVCSLCGRTRDQVLDMVVGPHTNVCDSCITAAMELAARSTDDEVRAFPEPCSYCRQTVTRTQFAGRHARICEDCVVMAGEILAARRARTALPTARVLVR